jgi:hypothetical protein
MKEKLVYMMAQSVMMCLFEGVFHLQEISTWFRRVLGLHHQAIQLACSFWMLGLGNLGCKDLVARSIARLMRAFKILLQQNMVVPVLL